METIELIAKLMEKIMKQKSVTINIPEEYEIDKEQSTFEKIVFKKKEEEVKTWNDLIGKCKIQSSIYISTIGEIISSSSYGAYSNNDRNLFIDKKHAKSALAMAQISQLMPYYGGAITDKEWGDLTAKHIIARNNKKIILRTNTNPFSFLAFHTRRQRDLFLRYNRELVKEYLMID